jgi:hypothetical protein
MAICDVFQIEQMTGRLRLLYPFLFAVLPLLNVLARSPGGSRLSDMALLIGIMLAGCAVAYAAVSLLARGRWSSPVVALVVLVVVLWFYASSSLALWARPLSPRVLRWGALASAGLLTAAVVWWLARRPAYLERVTTFLALTGFLLVTWMGVKAIAHQVHSRDVIRRSALARDLSQPVVVKQTGARAADTPHRDVYVIVLDEYPNGDVLRERFGLDNRVFEDSLRQLGFTIPRMVRSNYVHTLLSLPSLLNFSYLNRLATELGPRETDPTLANHLLEHNRTASFLKSQGYEFLFFPSQWWISTQHNRYADWEFQAWDGIDLRREATRSDLRRWFVRTTALPTDPSYDVDHVKRTLGALEQVPRVAQPTFAFAHILNPHRPLVFGAVCDTRGPKTYEYQLRCLNGLILRVVTSILQHSSPEPIILLQGDHGTNSLEYTSARTASAVSPAQSRERFGAFGAYYVPGGGSRLFADTVTVVNVLRNVLTYYFDADLPVAPDSLYMSLEQTPYSLVAVDPSSLAQPYPAARSTPGGPPWGPQR